MAPPEAAMAVVVISIRIGKLVVVAMQAHPVDGAVLAAEGAAGGEEALQPGGNPEGTV
ncbi:50S ribosomal protein L9 [Synechococcus sp. RS9916]|nr:50S ribosomal protein L9 [Synechococcus sp. RS9916]